MKKILKLLKFLSSRKFFYNKPPQKKIVIYDTKSEKFISYLFEKEEYYVLDVSLVKINIYIIIKLILNFKKLNFQNYFYEVIKKINPEYIFTFIDNDISYYRLKKKFKNIKFISIQNGIRFITGDILENFKTDKNIYFIDQYFTFDENYTNKISKHIKGNYSIIGSFKNNSFPINKNYEKGSICYISRISDIFLDFSNTMNQDKLKKNYDNWEKDLLNFVLVLLKNIKTLCMEKKTKLNILGSSPNFKQENILFDHLIGSKNYNFYPKKETYDSYKTTEKFEVLINPMSTFGYEAIAREKKVCFFYGDFIEGSNMNLSHDNKKGNFFSDSNEYGEVKRIINYLLDIDETSWSSELKKYNKKRFFYDKNNSKIKEFLRVNKITKKWHK